jgi:hypothetical protein
MIGTVPGHHDGALQGKELAGLGSSDKSTVVHTGKYRGDARFTECRWHDQTTGNVNKFGAHPWVRFFSPVPGAARISLPAGCGKLLA